MKIQPSYTGDVDAKGRLTMPSPLRARMLEPQGGKELFITSTTGKEVEVYPFSLWEDIEKKLNTLATRDSLATKFLDLAHFWGQSRRVDAGGRVRIPLRLCKSAALNGRVVLLGDPCSRITIMNPIRFKKLQSSPPPQY